MPLLKNALEIKYHLFLRNPFVRSWLSRPFASTSPAPQRIHSPLQQKKIANRTNSVVREKKKDALRRSLPVPYSEEIEIRA